MALINTSLRANARLLFVAALFMLNACSNRDLIAPFASDGCSLFPDQSLIAPADWCACCALHDAAYWRGGSEQQRMQADRDLRQCVLEKTGSQAFASLMYEGVRVGGSPYFFNWYRWGYGWPFQHKYQPLSQRQWQQVEQRWQEFEKSEVSICAAGEPSAAQLKKAVFE